MQKGKVVAVGFRLLYAATRNGVLVTEATARHRFERIRTTCSLTA